MKWLKLYRYKDILYAFVIYIIVVILSLFLPASEGYNTLTWKLLIAQIYAWPIFVLVFVALKFRKAGKNQNKDSSL